MACHSGMEAKQTFSSHKLLFVRIFYHNSKMEAEHTSESIQRTVPWGSGYICFPHLLVSRQPFVLCRNTFIVLTHPSLVTPFSSSLKWVWGWTCCQRVSHCGVHCWGLEQVQPLSCQPITAVRWLEVISHAYRGSCFIWLLRSFVKSNLSGSRVSNTAKWNLCKTLAQRKRYKVKPGTKQGWKCWENATAFQSTVWVDETFGDVTGARERCSKDTPWEPRCGGQSGISGWQGCHRQSRGTAWAWLGGRLETNNFLSSRSKSRGFSTSVRWPFKIIATLQG